MDPKKALAKAMNYCARGEKAPGDVRKKLVGWGLFPDQVKEILSCLYKDDFINEERYSLAFVRDKLKFNSWGRIKIRHHLRAKELKESAIDNAIAEIDEAAYHEKLSDLLAAKYHSLPDKDELMQTKAKLLRFAASRGFEADAIYPVLEKIIKK